MIPFLVALSLSFPIPTAPEIPVSAPVLGRAPFAQTNPRIVSSGSVALAAWSDVRSGSGDVIATRVAVDGTPLDNTGLVIRQHASLIDLFWNGTSFVAVTFAGLQYELDFVRVDGVVEKRTPLDAFTRYAARTHEGAATRLLFLPLDGYSPLATVLDLDGNVIRRGADDVGGTSFLAASNGSGFLVLRWQASFVAETLDRDGDVLGSKAPGLPQGFSPSALAGDGNGGYVLLGSLDGTLTLVRLHADGTVAAPPAALQQRDPLESGYRPVSLVTTSHGFAATWVVSLKSGHSLTYVSEDGGTPLMTFDFIGGAEGSAFDPDDDLVLTSYNDPATSTDDDIFIQKGTAWPQPLTESGATQTNPAIAAGPNGFLVSWAEDSGAGRQIFARRFSADGQPQEQPHNVFSATVPEEVAGFPSSSIASAGQSYLVAWGEQFARRMDANTGEWIDPSPFAFPLMTMASNGSSVLALTYEPCGPSLCSYARHVAMTGEPLLFNPVPLPGVTPASYPAIASNGHDYLAVWVDLSCPFGCPITHSRILMMRLGADGAHLDPAPIELTTNDGFSSRPSVSWNGKTYLVTWSGNGLSGAYVSSDGTVQPLGALGDGIEAIPAGGDFMILRLRLTNPGDVWEGKMLSGTDWTPIVSRPNTSLAAPVAATNGGYLMFAYARVDETAGHVARVFLDPRVFASRQRLVRR